MSSNATPTLLIRQDSSSFSFLGRTIPLPPSPTGSATRSLSSSTAAAAAAAVGRLVELPSSSSSSSSGLSLSIGPTIAKGSFGKLKLARATPTSAAFGSSRGTSTTTGSELVVVKLIDTKLGLDPSKEVAALTACNSSSSSSSSHVIKLLAYAPQVDIPSKHGNTHKTRAVMVFERAEADLFDVVSQGAVPESLARMLFRQVLSGISHIHSSGIAHRDIKPDNVLIMPDLSLKVTDFGFAAPAPEGSLLSTALGSEGYLSPEIMYGTSDGYDGRASDVWALGSLLFCVITAHMPIPNLGKQWYLDRLKDGQHELFFKAHLRTSSISESAMRLISRMLVWDPKERATLEEVASDPWVRGVAGVDMDEEDDEEALAALRLRMEKVREGKSDKVRQALAGGLLRPASVTQEVASVGTGAGTGAGVGSVGARMGRRYSSGGSSVCSLEAVDVLNVAVATPIATPSA